MLWTAALLAIALTPLPALGQIEVPDELPVDPDLPVKAGFDVERAFLGSQPTFTPLRDPEFEPLRTVLRRGDVRDDTPMLVFRIADRTMALVTSQMSYHHVAQGEMAGEPWMVTF
ncbi:MAG: hypothetical protein KJO11_11010 [Gemmatimonadetes bacterium]|nr:hypothetical protein [Gemmatimonadota bacterium]NNK63151.1 hypothetical protein [Gemmatimonadota bacterium]